MPTTAGQGFCAGVKCAGEPAGCCIGKPGAITCAIIKTLLESKNITRNTPIILYGRVDVPPKLLIDDDAATPQVDVKLRLSQTSVSMIADRDGDGIHEGTLESVPPCFKTGTPTTGECSLWEACVNLNFFADMELGQDTDGKPFIRTNVRNMDYEVSSGVLCGGGMDSDSGTTETIETISGGVIFPDIEGAVEDFTPDLVSEGLTFGGLVEFRNARLISIDNGSTPDEFDDYIGITGELEKATPTP